MHPLGRRWARMCFAEQEGCRILPSRIELSRAQSLCGRGCTKRAVLARSSCRARVASLVQPSRLIRWDVRDAVLSVLYKRSWHSCSSAVAPGHCESTQVEAEPALHVAQPGPTPLEQASIPVVQHSNPPSGLLDHMESYAAASQPIDSSHHPVSKLFLSPYR